MKDEVLLDQMTSAQLHLWKCLGASICLSCNGMMKCSDKVPLCHLHWLNQNVQNPEELCNCGDNGYDELAPKSQDDVSNSGLAMSIAHTRRHDWNEMCSVFSNECAHQFPERFMFQDEPKRQT